jgi:excisionase family DNA binding protein
MGEFMVKDRDWWKNRTLLRIDEVMDVLNVRSRSTIYELLHSGKLLAHNPEGVPGKRGIRILASSVEEYISRGTISPDTWHE